MYDAALKVLELLEEGEGPVSGEYISSRLGVSRSAVWKHVKELISMGYEISSSQKEGYRLTKKSNRLLPYEVHKKLRTSFIGKKIRYFENTPSKIWVGKHLASEGDAGLLQSTSGLHRDSGRGLAGASGLYGSYVRNVQLKTCASGLCDPHSRWTKSTDPLRERAG